MNKTITSETIIFQEKVHTQRDFNNCECHNIDKLTIAICQKLFYKYILCKIIIFFINLIYYEYCNIFIRFGIFNDVYI